jgi:alanyl-tRNA synthetase
MSSVNEVRSKFLNYFKGEGHELVSSSSLVPDNDPTLMFTNAGMVQFKNVFTGIEKRPYSRAVSSQKCVRAGGKHNDLDNVGFTARHLTFFEMLGNFSFGDYFKEQAIELAWNMLTKEFELSQEKLLVTVYHDDEIAFDLWKKIAGLPDEKIIRISTNDNFWSMGDTGPCGPCSEIFYDYGDKVWGGPPGSAKEDGDRFIEIWNLVFMQYDQQIDGERLKLPKPSVDTGMGLERFSALLQGTNNVFETDLFKSLIAASANATNTDPNGEGITSHRVIADHLRSMSFLVAEGVLPSNEGRGYVLRRIMRRAMRHATLLGAKEPIIHSLVSNLVQEMGQAYPELARAESMIAETIRLEEGRFLKTLSRGLLILDDESASLNKGDMLDGATAFKLYDTYGFPLDLTQDALRTRGINVDLAGFQNAMAAQKTEARKSWAGAGGAATEQVWFEVADSAGASEFLGYKGLSSHGEIDILVKDSEIVKSINAGETGFVIFNQTPFYAQSGGQIGDIGYICAENVKAQVLGVSKQVGGVFAHEVKVIEGELQLGMALEQKVDANKRAAICANHSATHLLHEALRQVLGTHVAQKGSLVDAQKLRFDFSHTKPVSADEIVQVENIANAMILQNTKVETSLMGVDEAREAGAMALFGEKYDDEVRVVSMGIAIDGEKQGKTFSMELCGGTHVKRTGDIGLVSIVQETSVASGVRRIEALTAKGAFANFVAQEKQLKTIAATLKTSPSDAFSRVASLLEERKKLERELSEVKKKLAMGGGEKQGASSDIKEISGIRFLGKSLSGISPRDLKGLVDEGKKTIGSGIIVIAAISEDGKGAIVVGVSDDLTDKYSAVDLVRIGSAAMGGKGGGGRPDMAQAGGPDGAKAQIAIEEIAKKLVN